MRSSTVLALCLVYIASASASMQAPLVQIDTKLKNLVAEPIIPHNEVYEVLVKRSPKELSVANGVVNLGKLKSNLEAWEKTKESVVKKGKTAKQHKEKWGYRVKAYDNYIMATAMAQYYRDAGKTMQAQAWQARADDLFNNNTAIFGTPDGPSIRG